MLTLIWDFARTHYTTQRSSPSGLTKLYNLCHSIRNANLLFITQCLFIYYPVITQFFISGHLSRNTLTEHDIRALMIEIVILMAIAVVLCMVRITIFTVTVGDKKGGLNTKKGVGWYTASGMFIHLLPNVYSFNFQCYFTYYPMFIHLLTDVHSFNTKCLFTYYPMFIHLSTDVHSFNTKC